MDPESEKAIVNAICHRPKISTGPCLNYPTDHLNLIGMGPSFSLEQKEALLAHISSCSTCSKSMMELLVAKDWLETPEGKARINAALDEHDEMERGERDDSI